MRAAHLGQREWCCRPWCRRGSPPRLQRGRRDGAGQTWEPERVAGTSSTTLPAVPCRQQYTSPGLASNFNLQRASTDDATCTHLLSGPLSGPLPFRSPPSCKSKCGGGELCSFSASFTCAAARFALNLPVQDAGCAAQARWCETAGSRPQGTGHSAAAPTSPRPPRHTHITFQACIVWLQLCQGQGTSTHWAPSPDGDGARNCSVFTGAVDAA